MDAPPYNTQFSFAGGQEQRISTYGQVKLSRLADGDFYVIDNGNDSGANVTITDNTTGASPNTTIFYSY